MLGWVTGRQRHSRVQPRKNARRRRRQRRFHVAQYSLGKWITLLGELCPGIRVDTFNDHVGGSAALRKGSTTADVFIIATGPAKHAATTFIEDRRPKDLSTLYANAGQRLFGAGFAVDVSIGVAR